MLKRFKNKKVDGDWLNTNFPCMMACPAHTNAGRYVGLIAEGRFEEAYRIARDPNPLASICGRVCAHPAKLPVDAARSTGLFPFVRSSVFSPSSSGLSRNIPSTSTKDAVRTNFLIKSQ